MTGSHLEDIAKQASARKSTFAMMGDFAVLAALCLSLSGCFSAAMDFADGTKVDKSLTTSAIANEPDKKSDQDTVRNAVSAADLKTASLQALPWANASTGSAGVITSINEDQSNGVLCRSFVTSRHAYDGIAKFYGRTCLVGDGQWQLVNFDKQI